jgi:hypothetical protein
VRRFTRFACVDWSGARGPRQKGIAVACCSEGDTAPLLLGQPGAWSREAVLDWLLEETARGGDLLVGIDFSASLPFDAQQGFFPGWDAAPRTARELWAFIESICADEPHLEAGAFVDHVEASTFFRRPGGRTGARFGTGIGRLRAVERRTVPSPASCFNLVGAKQVGKSSLTGMRLLHRLAGRTPIWPFDEAPPSGPVIVEIYTGLAAVEARRPRNRTKMLEPHALDAALVALGSRPHPGPSIYDDHSADAILTAAWLRRAAHRPILWRPPGLDAVRQTEGWTFGVA